MISRNQLKNRLWCTNIQSASPSDIMECSYRPECRNGNKRNKNGNLTDGLVLDGKYKVVGRLGSGGQGTAYLALVDDGQTHQEVVLKEYVLPVHKGTAIMEVTLDKLKKEVELLQRLDHPSIVKCLGCFVEDYRGYVILEYIKRRTPA